MGPWMQQWGSIGISWIYFFKNFFQLCSTKKKKKNSDSRHLWLFCCQPSRPWPKLLALACSKSRPGQKLSQVKDQAWLGLAFFWLGLAWPLASGQSQHITIQKDLKDGLHQTTVDGWINCSGERPHWKDSVLRKIDQGNDPGHNKGGSQGVLVCAPYPFIR